MASVLVPERNRACIDTCTECVQACNATAYQCCLPGGNVECGKLCLDCAAFCQLCIVLLSRGSPLAVELCRICADICAACADSCERCGMDYCLPCAEVCRRCAAQCREMAAMAV